MKIAVLGTTGMLGNYIYLWLKQRGCAVSSVKRDEVDAANVTMQELDKFVRWYDVVINCMGVIKQKADDISERDIIAVNTMFPHSLQCACQLNGVKLIHISTDCVFSGEPTIYPWSESHTPNARDLYGRSKALGEPSQATVIRTSIIGSEKKGKKSLLEWVKSKNNQECDGYVNHEWNGVTCLQLAKFCEYIIENKIFWEGVRHYHSPHAISKYSLIRLIAHVYNLNVKVNAKNTSSSKNMVLSSNYPMAFAPPEIINQLNEMLEFDRNNNLL